MINHRVFYFLHLVERNVNVQCLGNHGRIKEFLKFRFIQNYEIVCDAVLLKKKNYQLNED